jgi:hypothetical protein
MLSLIRPSVHYDTNYHLLVIQVPRSSWAVQNPDTLEMEIIFLFGNISVKYAYHLTCGFYRGQLGSALDSDCTNKIRLLLRRACPATPRTTSRFNQF